MFSLLIVISFLGVLAAVGAIVKERKEHKRNIKKWERDKNRMDEMKKT